MPMSLKCMIAKWLHKGQISQEEYDAVIKKLDGHDKQIRADAINEYVTRFEAENITDANAERLKPFIFEMHRLAEQMQKGAENE